MVAPSILSADFSRMGEECAHAMSVGADLLHLDVMDGHFVPNLTMGPDMCRGVRRACPTALLDVHLMVTDPGQYVDSFADAGADHLTFHVEVVKTRKEVDALVARIRKKGMTAGIAVNPPTAIDALLSVVEKGSVDLALVMSVNPGFSGQSFIMETLDKTRAARRALGEGVRVEMDGGVSPANAAEVRAAGCDVLVSASAFFGRPAGERAGVGRALRGEGEAGPRLGERLGGGAVDTWM